MEHTPACLAVIQRIHSSKHAPNTPLSEFWLLQFLPLEIQLQIWSENLPNTPRLSPILVVKAKIQIDMFLLGHLSFEILSGKNDDLISEFSICKSSRRAALGYFKDTITGSRGTTIYFNASTTPVHIVNLSDLLTHSMCQSQYGNMSLLIQITEAASSIKQLCIDRCWVPTQQDNNLVPITDLDRWEQIFLLFKNLEVLSFWVPTYYQCPLDTGTDEVDFHGRYGSAFDSNALVAVLYVNVQLLWFLLHDYQEEVDNRFRLPEKFSVMGDTCLRKCHGCLYREYHDSRQTRADQGIHGPRGLNYQTWGHRFIWN